MQTDYSVSKTAGHRWLDETISWLALAAIVAVGALILGSLLAACNYGFDFTDEGSYLNWINAPFPVRDRQFGYFYHPLWVLVGKDLALLRQANVLITMGLAFVLSLILLRGVGAGGVSGPMARMRLGGLAFGLSTVAGIALTPFLTPSYNSLAFQALMVSAIGLIIAERSFSRISILGWVILGMGGCLAFMGKPTTAAALAVFALSYVILARIEWPALLGLAMGTAFLLLAGFVFVVDGSPMVFIARLKEAVGDLVCIGAGQTNWLRIDTLDITRDALLIPVLLVVFACAWLGTMASASCGRTVAGAQRRSAVGLTGRAVWLVLFLAAVAASFVISFDLTSWRDAGEFHVVPLAGVGLGAACGAFVVCRGRLWTILDRRAWCSILLLLLMPYAFALGTSNNYWRQMQQAGLFWICAGIVVLVRLPDGGDRWRACLLAIAVAQAIAMNSIVVGFEHPYRQPRGLFQNHTVVNLGPGESRIRLSAESVDYINALRERAAENGFKPGTPVLDLTGHSPGALFVLGAKPVGTAWLSGGYPGSTAMVARILDRVPAYELRQAWVLTEPEGSRPLPASLLERYGLSLERDYGLVAIIFSPEGGASGGVMQRLYKPGVASRVELRCMAEAAFPIILPPQPIACEMLAEGGGVTHGWINVGWRGAVSVQGVEGEHGVMRLVAGVPGPERGESSRHCLLLQPAATGDQGLAIVPESQLAEFSCDLRSTTPASSGRLRLRLDAKTAAGWVYAARDRWVELGERWTNHRVNVHLKGEFKGITPILEWNPGAEGATLELRAPVLRWIKIVNIAPVTSLSGAGLSDSGRLNNNSLVHP